jgi:phosphoribosyl-ATP pyrophosphohydrolase/phosphoribosyl-AMP cyclohydrolase
LAAESVIRDYGPEILDEVYEVILQRKATMPEGSYVASLLNGGWRQIDKKVVEEAGETIIAAAENDPQRLAEEAADLIFHTLVLLADADTDPALVWKELADRRQ